MNPIEFLINTTPFALYTLILIKLFQVWRIAGVTKMRSEPPMSSVEKRECKQANLLMAILALLTICTLTFMAANAYALLKMETTLLSMKVFQMFVIGNCAAYWLVLELITRDSVAPKIEV